MGRPILIREDRGDGGKHGRGVGGVAGARVFVGNLSWQVTWQALKDHMRSVSGGVGVDVVDVFVGILFVGVSCGGGGPWSMLLLLLLLLF